MNEMNDPKYGRLLRHERIGSGLGLAAAVAGTAYLFMRGAGTIGARGHYWTALLIAGPIFALGGWLLGRFLGAYMVELRELPRREKIGFLLGAAGGLALGDLLGGFSSDPRAPSALMILGLFIGPGIGRDIAKRKK